jgi:5-methylcytosine-specific restriction enzyme A
MPQQFCSMPNCPNLVASGRCAAHAPIDRYARQAYAATHRWYGSQRWQDLRAAVLRAEPFCRACRAAGRLIVTTDIDHVVKHDGDPDRFWDRANLQGLCKACHSRKTARGA